MPLFCGTPQVAARSLHNSSTVFLALLQGEMAMPATAHLSYWHETAGGMASHYPPLEENIAVDVAILGGGITGLTAALHLKLAGKTVAVLEAGQIGAGTSGYTSGHLDATTDLPL